MRVVFVCATCVPAAACSWSCHLSDVVAEAAGAWLAGVRPVDGRHTVHGASRRRRYDADRRPAVVHHVTGDDAGSSSTVLWW